MNRDRLNFLIRENSVEPPAKRVKIPLGKCAIIIIKKREKIALLHSLKPSEIARFFLSLSFSSFSMKDIKEKSFFFSGRIIPLVLFHVFVDATMLYCSLTSITIHLVDVLF